MFALFFAYVVPENVQSSSSSFSDFGVHPFSMKDYPVLKGITEDG